MYRPFASNVLKVSLSHIGWGCCNLLNLLKGEFFAVMKYEDYRDQLPSLCDSLQSCDKVQNVHYESSGSAIHADVQCDIENLATSHLECKIIYSQTYREPQLLLRIWKFTQIDGIICLKPWFPKDLDRVLSLPDWFRIGLDTISTSADHKPATWYSVHACDTGEIVGKEPFFRSTYLSRWASIFLYGWMLTLCSKKKKLYIAKKSPQ